MIKLFLPQALLEQWSAEERVELVGSTLSIPSEQSKFSLAPAVHFAKLVSGTDEKRLVSRVKTVEQLQALGAEQMMDSVLLGDAAYEVVPGYIALVDAPSAATQAKGSSDADLLASFIIDKLT